MSKHVSFSIPHNLGEEEAKRRITVTIDQLRRKYSHFVGHLDARWEGNNLVGNIGALGQFVRGQVTVLPTVVQVDLSLPLLLSAISGKIEEFGLSTGRKVLRTT